MIEFISSYKFLLKDFFLFTITFLSLIMPNMWVVVFFFFLKLYNFFSYFLYPRNFLMYYLFIGYYQGLNQCILSGSELGIQWWFLLPNKVKEETNFLCPTTILNVIQDHPREVEEDSPTRDVTSIYSFDFSAWCHYWWLCSCAVLPIISPLVMASYCLTKLEFLKWRVFS